MSRKIDEIIDEIIMSEFQHFSEEDRAYMKASAIETAKAIFKDIDKVIIESQVDLGYLNEYPLDKCKVLEGIWKLKKKWGMGNEQED